VTQFTFATGN